MIVLSAVSIRNAGPLTVLKSAVKSLGLNKKKVCVIVGSENLLTDIKNIDLVVIKWPRKSWFHRLFFEYIWLYFWSKKRDIDCWISFHDITPLVKSKKQLVYCHNPMPFFSVDFKTILYDYKQFLFSYLYIFVYKFFINRNNIVVVQQDWIKNKFKKFYQKKIVVLPPMKVDRKPMSNRKLRLIYPAQPRATKNHLYLIDFYKKINKYCNIEIIFTFSGNENKMARKIKTLSKNFDGIIFTGWLNKTQLSKMVANSDAIVFPSTAETWGLPMIEFSKQNILTFVSDADFAAETCAGLDNIIFFNSKDVRSLLRIFKSRFNLYENDRNKYLCLNDVIKELI